MTAFRHSATIVPAESAWGRLAPATQASLRWSLWAITWLGLLAGCFDASYWRWVVAFSAAHALLMLALVGFRPLVFPAQLRIAYLAWVALGTYAPYASVMMIVTLAGLAANLLVGWCPLARMLYLLPWNRRERLDLDLLARVFLSGPVPGRFEPPSRLSVTATLAPAPCNAAAPSPSASPTATMLEPDAPWLASGAPLRSASLTPPE
jgi:hypothetical protein